MELLIVLLIILAVIVVAAAAFAVVRAKQRSGSVLATRDALRGFDQNGDHS